MSRPQLFGAIAPPARNHNFGTHCSHCSRKMGTFESGMARGGPDFKQVCHPNVATRPDCYLLVTVYGHSQPCTSPTCYEDGHELLEYVNQYAKKNSKRVRRPKNKLTKVSVGNS